MKFRKEGNLEEAEEAEEMIDEVKKIKMLKMLDKQVETCTSCPLHVSGRAVPYWSPDSRYVIIGEAPGFNETRRGVPFVGAAGRILSECITKAGFSRKEEFLIINSVQCRPVDPVNSNRNGKPTEEQISTCSKWVRKYIKIINPEKVLCLGNYAKSLFDNSLTGILSSRGVFRELSPIWHREKDYNVLFTVHPAYCIYNEEEGKAMLEEDLRLFYNTKFERESDWLLSEEDFKL